jgi:hypothetical protein
LSWGCSQWWSMFLAHAKPYVWVPAAKIIKSFSQIFVIYTLS